MIAPDKIYLLKVELEERWPGITEASELEPKKEVCYICKDALLEWARENHKRMVEVHSDYTKIYDEYFRGLIEKLESL